MEIKKVTVLGAGLMGHGITQVMAQIAKYDVYMRDIKQDKRQSTTLRQERRNARR
jgi:3-hydroxyacyl-CoA dehydrogenase